MLFATVLAAVVLLPASARGKPGSFCPCGACNASSVATYRLADTFKDRVDKKYACFWPQSIACDYVKTKRWGRDLSALLAAVRRHEAAHAVDRPAPAEVVWHLRLGDTSGCERPFHNQACAKKESHQKTKKVDVHSQYFFQKDYFKAALSRLSKKLQHVTFVYSTTHVKCHGSNAAVEKNRGTAELPRSFVDRSLEYVRDASEFHPVCKSNLQPDFNMRVFEEADTSSSALLRELDESDRFVQKSAESTSIWPR